MNKIAAILLALVIALSMCEAVVALESKTINREKGVSAYADWVEESPELYTYTFLSLTETDDGTDMYLSIYKYWYDSELGEWLSEDKWGYKFTTEDVFDVDKQLSTATLSPVDIELFVSDGTVQTVAIQAQWTGGGDLEKGMFKMMSKSGDFMSKYSENSKFREATATGFIGDYDPGVSDYGSLVEFKYAEMWMEK
ncbi:MAG: hypothetical protein WAV32_04785 [Halobacteriota archaeon]